jgi:DNA-binding SARP family transcriptional activator/tetratricopeptide (TPR) repeat protein
MTHLSLALLGPVRIALDDQPIAAFEYAKVRALLAYLAAERGRAHSRDALAELLWPDQPPQVARNSLRQALAKLRQAIRDHDARPPFLLIARETLQFNPAAHLTLDVAAFEELAAPGEHCPHQPGASCAACVARWEQAVALYGGPFLDQATPRDSLGFEEWALVRRERYERQAAALLASLAAHYEHGNAAQALRYARQHLELDAWNEAVHRQVMRVLAKSGQRGAALAHYAHCRRVLAEDLGVEPEDETVRLYEEIRAKSGDKEPRRQGESQEQISPSPALPVSLSEGFHLPLQPTAFIGRESELEELSALLSERACRMITLIGPGGAGKTRLALRAAELHAPHFAHGACWAPLAALDNPALLAGELAHALGLTLDESADPSRQLVAGLAGRELLLVLDNFEQLLGPASVGLLAELLAGAPGVKLLVTSREPLRLQWEWLFDLRGLPYLTRASHDNDMASAAATLFLERARQARRARPVGDDEARAVARICQLVEGMPLALELAAAASREQSFAAIAAAIAADLDVLTAAQWDRPERHHSMRAAFEYSWRALTGAQQGALAALSVFRGGFAPEAAAAVVFAAGEAAACQAMLAELADKSLLYESPNGRYQLHELIRQFAAQKLEELGAATGARGRHLGFVVDYVEAIEPRLRGAEQAAALDALERDHDNVRAALGWALDQGQREPAARVAGALWRFWWVRGHVREGRQWLAQLVGRAAGDAVVLAPPVRAKALNALGALAEEQGDFAEAAEHYAGSLALYRPLADAAGIASALNNLGGVRYKQGEFTRAAECFSESAALARAQSDRYGTAVALHNLAGAIYDSGGDLARASALLEETLALWDELGMRQGTATTLSSLGQIALIQGDHAAAARWFEQSLPALRDLADGRSASMSLAGLGRALHRLGDQRAALAAYREALGLRYEIGDKLGVAECCEGLGEVALAVGAPARALRLYGAAAALRDAIGSPVLPIDQAAYDAALATARAQLDRTSYDAAWQTGQAMTIDAAVEYALVQ